MFTLEAGLLAAEIFGASQKPEPKRAKGGGSGILALAAAAGATAVKGGDVPYGW